MHAPTDDVTHGQDDLFTEEVSLLLPARMAVEGNKLGGMTRHSSVHSIEVVCRLKPLAVRYEGGLETTLSNDRTRAKRLRIVGSN